MGFIVGRFQQLVNEVGVAPLIVIGIVAAFIIWWILRP